MKTTKQTFAVLLIISALVVFGGALGYGQGRPRPTPTPPLFPDCTQGPHHTCVGTCPTLWAAGNPNPMPVQPFTDHAHPDPCHKIKGACSCAYRNESLFDCNRPQGHGPCDGHCPDLYRTPQDAQNHVNPVPFNTKICKGQETGCFCFYY